MRKKKEDRASWVVHKPPAEMPPESPRTSARAAEGSAQEAGSQPPEKLPPSASTDALPTPRLFTASESASSDSIGHPAPPAKTYSEIVGILEEAGAASEPVPVAAATPSSAQRQPDAASDATSTAFAFDPEQRYNAGVKTPLIPPLGARASRAGAGFEGKPDRDCLYRLEDEKGKEGKGKGKETEEGKGEAQS